MPEAIHGYSTEEFTHMAVAAIVASGGADAGFGIEAAARRFGLHFISVTWENSWFALPRDSLSKSAVSELVGMLRSTDFKSQADALPGYDAAQAGTIVPVDSVIAYGDAPVVWAIPPEHPPRS